MSEKNKPVLAAEPTTTADALKRSREAIQEVLDSPLVPSGGNSIRAAQVALVLNERGLLAALAPEPAERDEWQEGLVSWEYVKDDAAADMQNHPLSINLLKAWYVAGFENGAQTPPPAVSPEEPKPLDPKPWVRPGSFDAPGDSRFADMRSGDCRFAPRPEFDQVESHYPKDGKR